FALRAADTPGRLRLVGEVKAGAAALPEVVPGTTARIMTGAPPPPGAGAAAPPRRAPPPRGGEPVELPADALTSATLGLLASLGLGELAVRRPPRVAILSTGDELQPPGAPLAPGQIHDANGIALAAAITEAGGEPVPLERTPDDPAQVSRQRR